MMRRAGTSMLEIMVVVVLVGLAIIPLMNLGGSTHRQTFFTEHQLLAMTRARLLLDVGASLDFEVLDALAQRKNDVPVKVDLGKLFDNKLDTLYAATGASTANYTVKLQSMTQELEFNRIDASSGMLTARIGWTFAADKQDKGHKVELARVVHRREVGLNRRYELK